MKHLHKYIALIILVAFSSCGSTRYVQDDNYAQDYSQQQGITYQRFYNELSPYGNWVNYQNYGYVWRPVMAGFRPYYTNGNWIYTNYGWTWASNYNWGWAPFHYGRWINDRFYGWMWVPGYKWAPAWVSWRGGGNYYGWAPLGPGMNINFSAGAIPVNYWTFVPRRYINNPRISNYYINHSRNSTILNNTSVIDNSPHRQAYNPGPSVADVERATRAPIRTLKVEEANQPGVPRVSNGSVRVFRPLVKQEPENSTNIRPSRVTDLQEIRQANDNTDQPNKNPVREFPKDQTPQINKNEPPVNRRPSVAPDKNEAPARILPNENKQVPPADRNSRPARELNKATPPPTDRRNETRQRPAVNRSTPSTPPPNRPVVNERREIKVVKPAQDVRKFPTRENDHR